MANFDEIVQKTAETAEALAGKSSVVIGKATDAARSVVRAGKLNMDIVSERDRIRRNYAQLGKLYYEAHKDDPEEAFEQVVADIALSEEKIAAMREELGYDDEGEIEVEIIEEEPAPEAAPEEAAPEAAPEEEPAAEETENAE